MRRLLRSARFRRKAAWAGVLVAVAAGVAATVVFVGNTGHKQPERFSAGKPQIVPPAPKADVFTAAERRQVRTVAARFVESAVYRHHVDDSWEITTAELHQGISRTAWAKGDIPVVPYRGDAVAEVRWRLNYSYPKDVALKVAFFPTAKSGFDRQVFDIELENHGTDTAPNWLVSYWAPAGGVDLQSAQPGAGPGNEVVGATRGQLGAVWLFVPMGVIFGGLVGLVAFLIVRGHLRHRRAQRLYSSRISPS
jgi:hypothetical protein